MRIAFLYIIVCIFLLLNYTIRAFSQQVDTTSTQMLFELSLEDLMNIDIVSSTQQNQNIADAPSIVSVITAAQIKERGYLSIAEALSSVAGFDVISDHFQPNLGIRGINGGLRSWSRLIKVMIDGQNVSQRSTSDNYLDASLIPIEVIDKIEIIRGPNSAIYGKNAFLGVVNIITKSGSELKHNSISNFLSNVNENISYGISAMWGGKNKNFDFIFASTYSQIDNSGYSPHNVPGSNLYNNQDISQNETSNPLGVFLKLNYEKESIGKLSFEANQQIINSNAEFLDWGTLTHNNKISLFNGYERISYAKTILGNIDANLSFAHSRGKPIKKEILDVDSDPNEWIERDFSYTSYDAIGNISYFFDDLNSFTLGLDYTADIHDHQKYYTANNQGLRTLNPGGTDGIKNFNNVGVYLQMIFNASEFFRINYLKNLTLTAGYRFDYHNIYGDVLTYRLAAVYRISQQLSTKLMYGTSFNAPSPVQLYSNYISPGGIVGNPNLKPEKGKTLEWALLGKFLKKINFSTNVFYTEIEDKIEYLLPYGQITNITAKNVSNIYSAGIETELNASIYNNTAYLNYSYQKSIIEKTDPLFGDIRINTALYPSHQIKFGDVIHFPKYFTNINIEGRFISSRIASDQNNFTYDPINYAINRYELDPYFTLDLMISTTDVELLKNSKTKISLKIQNLLNTKFYYPGFSNYDMPGIGRTVYFRITHYI